MSELLDPRLRLTVSPDLSPEFIRDYGQHVVKIGDCML